MDRDKIYGNKESSVINIWVRFLFIGTLIFSTTIAQGNSRSIEEDKLIFEKILSEWTEAFNQKNLEKTCGLFSKSVIATYRGSPEKNYESICNNFKKIFADENKKYQYRFEIHQVYRSLDLAVLRVTWYLTLDEPGKKTSLTQDEGMDVLQQDANQEWKIINFLSFAAG